MINYHNDVSKRQFIDAYKAAKAFKRKSESRRSYLRSIRTLNRFKKDTGGITIYPDFASLSFCWHACGMYGGFIFHSSAMEWSVHT
jgi:hypothetical protein